MLEAMDPGLIADWSITVGGVAAGAYALSRFNLKIGGRGHASDDCTKRFASKPLADPAQIAFLQVLTDAFPRHRVLTHVALKAFIAPREGQSSKMLRMNAEHIATQSADYVLVDARGRVVCVILTDANREIEDVVRLAGLQVVMFTLCETYTIASVRLAVSRERHLTELEVEGAHAQSALETRQIDVSRGQKAAGMAS